MPETFVPRRKQSFPCLDKVDDLGSLESVASVILPTNQLGPSPEKSEDPSSIKMLEMFVFMCALMLWVYGIGMLIFFSYLTSTQQIFLIVPSTKSYSAAVILHGFTGVGDLLAAWFTSYCQSLDKRIVPIHAIGGLFSVLVTASFVIGEIVCGIETRLLKETVIYRMLEGIPFYSNTSGVNSRWDTIQEKLGCCGLKSPKDWVNDLKELPPSCCYQHPEKNASLCSKWYMDGCFKRYVHQQNSNACYMVGTAATNAWPLMFTFTALVLVYINFKKEIASLMKKYAINTFELHPLGSVNEDLSDDNVTRSGSLVI